MQLIHLRQCLKVVCSFKSRVYKSIQKQFVLSNSRTIYNYSRVINKRNVDVNANKNSNACLLCTNDNEDS